ncbi:GHKL domain-containing protein [Chitinophaga agrisoli]|uniref:GHKL domain-containing protein n=2 Tax=Chitinophaga agrisoli TaxID=2607653 RepID=A0A5B2VQC7_9BACT|nr:GHKL domain-containing protein [Chitinophaga agrisoli]
MMLNNRSGLHWLLKYKLYHIPFWCLYHYLWWVVAMGNPLKAASYIFILPYTVKFAFYVIFQAVAVYFNLYFLIPRYLEKSRYALYISLLLLTIGSAASIIVSGYYLGAFVSGKSFEALYGPGTYCLFYFFGNALPSTFASITLAMSIKLTRNWLRTRKRQQLLEKEKLETELNFLKNQFNPHFLFNTINSIFFLIHKNPDKASVSLAKFSELLRYQLYECNDKQIPLSKEITYLENSIALEKLRLNSNVAIDFQVQQQYAEDMGIAPFILMTFVENAFKHVSKHTDQQNWISIQLNIASHTLDFSISNSSAPDPFGNTNGYSGIGLKNVQRRLDLIYPGKYKLDIQNKDTVFAVKLHVYLSELANPQLMPDTALIYK